MSYEPTDEEVVQEFEEIDRALSLTTPDETTPPESGWQDGRIATMDAFHRAAREYRESLEAAREVDAQHEAEIAPLLAKLKSAQERADAARKPIQDHADWLLMHLYGFAQTHRKEILKGRRHDAKSALLQSGVRVAWRTQPEALRLRDGLAEQEALLTWAKSASPDLVRTKEAPDLPAIKRFCGRTRTPPGMERIPESETLTITTDADGDEP